MADSRGPARKRRSQAWFGREDKMGFIYRSWVKNRGMPHDKFDGRPVIGICNTWSELTPCNTHFRDLADHVRQGVLEAGGFPLEFPVMSLGETLLRPTAMLYRNLASMDVEEIIRANPLDGVVLLMGCDKTTPALLMGAASVDLPADRRVGRADAVGLVPRRAHRLGHQHLVAAARSCAPARSRSTSSTRPRAACTARRPLHDDGHRLDDGVAWSRRSASACPATPPYPAVDARRNLLARDGRPAHRRDGGGRPDACRRSSPARRSRTPSASTPRSAARPMR